MDANEKFVRDHWESVNWGMRDLAGKNFAVIVYDDDVGTGFTGNTQSEAWKSAAKFTRERLKQIYRMDIGIGLLQECLPGEGWHNDDDVLIAGEILAREQAALAELKRGMKNV